MITHPTCDKHTFYIWVSKQKSRTSNTNRYELWDDRREMVKKRCLCCWIKRVERQIHLSIICHSWTNKILLFHACSFSFRWNRSGMSSSGLHAVCVERDAVAVCDTATMYQHIYILCIFWVFPIPIWALYLGIGIASMTGGLAANANISTVLNHIPRAVEWNMRKKNEKPVAIKFRFVWSCNSLLAIHNNNSNNRKRYIRSEKIVGKKVFFFSFGFSVCAKHAVCSVKWVSYVNNTNQQWNIVVERWMLCSNVLHHVAFHFWLRLLRSPSFELHLHMLVFCAFRARVTVSWGFQIYSQSYSMQLPLQHRFSSAVSVHWILLEDINII